MLPVRLPARFAALGLVGVLCFGADEAPGFKLTKKYPVPGDGGFDYVTFDGASNRIYASHGTEVNVLDADTGKVLGKVEDTPGVHGIAIVTELHRGFTTNGRNATVSVFDTNTFKTIKSISVAGDPDFITYDPNTKRVLVCHGDGKVITAIDPAQELGHDLGLDRSDGLGLPQLSRLADQDRGADRGAGRGR